MHQRKKWFGIGALLVAVMTMSFVVSAAASTISVAWSQPTKPTGYKALDDSMGVMVNSGTTQDEFIFGGYSVANGGDIVYTNNVYEYDPIANTDTKLKISGVAITMPTQTVCPYGDDGSARLGCSGNRGGTTPPALCPFNEWNVVASVGQVDPSTGFADQDNQLCTVNAYTHTAVAAWGTDIYLAGGRAGVAGCTASSYVCDDVVYATDGVYRFDPATKTFATTDSDGWTMPPLPAPRGSGGSWINVDLAGNTWLHFVGGYTDGFHAVDATDNWQLEIHCSSGCGSAPTWQTEPSLPSGAGRSHFATNGPFGFAGGAYVFGGQTGMYSGGVETDGAEVGPVGSPEYCGSVFSPNPPGTTTCTGADGYGQGQNIHLLKSTYYWEPGQSSWTAKADMPEYRSHIGGQNAYVVDTNSPAHGHLLFCGGDGGATDDLHDTATKACFDYDKTADSWSAMSSPSNDLGAKKYTGVGGVLSVSGVCTWWLIEGAPLSTSNAVEKGTISNATC